MTRALSGRWALILPVGATIIQDTRHGADHSLAAPAVGRERRMAGGSMVTAAVTVLEDDPTAHVGAGAVQRTDGHTALAAGLFDGHALQTGAAAPHLVQVAHAGLDATQHTLTVTRSEVLGDGISHHASPPCAVTRQTPWHFSPERALEATEQGEEIHGSA